MALDCAFKASQVPAAKYDQLGGLKLTRPKIYSHKIYPAKKVEGNPYKIVKSKDPDCGTYNPDQSFRKTQLPGQLSKFNVDKKAKTSFLDDAQKAKKHVPAPGHYKLDVIDKAYKRLSPSPVQTRVRRH